MLSQHLTRSLSETTTTGVRLCLALLFILNLASWAFGQRGNDSTEFLQLVAHCSSQISSTSGPQITMQGMLYTTLLCIERLQSSTARRTNNIDLWQAVDAMELLMLASPSSRERVKQQLVSWLLTDDQGSMACDDIFQKHIVEDIKVAWLSRHQYDAQALHDEEDW